MTQQFAWLDVFDGRWLFLNGDMSCPARSWVDENTALSELQEEGWTIVASHPRRSSARNSRRKSYGYAMVRTVH